MQSIVRVKLGVLGAVIGAHLLAVIAIISNQGVSQRPFLRPLIVTLIETNNPARQTANTLPLVTNITVLQDPSDLLVSLPTFAPPIFKLAEVNANAINVAPQLLDTKPPDMSSFAREALLLPGESAEVILRVEILSDGHVGQVKVDVSSGSGQVDAAAMKYARACLWVPGRSRGSSEVMWVRHGVRLAA